MIRSLSAALVIVLAGVTLSAQAPKPAAPKPAAAAI